MALHGRSWKDTHLSLPVRFASHLLHELPWPTWPQGSQRLSLRATTEGRETTTRTNKTLPPQQRVSIR